jgi:hypothetical protein
MSCCVSVCVCVVSMGAVAVAGSSHAGASAAGDEPAAKEAENTSKRDLTICQRRPRICQKKYVKVAFCVPPARCACACGSLLPGNRDIEFVKI